MKTFLTALTFIGCCLAEQTRPGAEALLATAKQQALSGDYGGAAATITRARTGIASLGDAARDFAFIKSAGLTDSSAATPDMLIALLAQASLNLSASDTKHAIQQLDLASMTASFLLAKTPPPTKASVFEERAGASSEFESLRTGTRSRPYITPRKMLMPPAIIFKVSPSRRRPSL